MKKQSTNLTLYLRYELAYFIFMGFMVLSPLWAFYHFSEFTAPGLTYTIIGCLFFFQYFFDSTKKREKKLYSKITKNLEKKYERKISHKEIQAVAIKVVQFRIISISIISFFVLILSALYNRLYLF